MVTRPYRMSRHRSPFVCLLIAVGCCLGGSHLRADAERGTDAVGEFEAAINRLVRAVETAPASAAFPLENRARMAIGSAVSCFCRTRGNRTTWERERSDANVVEFVYSAIIGDLELAATLCPPGVDLDELTQTRLKQILAFYPVGRMPGRKEMLYLCQVLALASVAAPTVLHDEIAKEWTVGQARLAGERGLPLMVAFACMQWSAPEGMDTGAYEQTPVFSMLTRQFLSTRESAFRLTRPRSGAANDGPQDD